MDTPCLCALLSSLAFAFSVSSASATFPGANGRITYSAANPAKRIGIFGVLPDGVDGPRRLQNDADLRGLLAGTGTLWTGHLPRTHFREVKDGVQDGVQTERN
jgi:hypothetical protein